jgi:hypothetical protein
MQLFETRRLKRRRSRWVKLGGLVATAAVLWGVWKVGEAAIPRYHAWKQTRALKQAREFIANRDAPNAQLALEVAMREVPGNPDTIRVAAGMLEQVGSAQAMRLRRAVIQVAPGSVVDEAALVQSCLRFRDFNAAKDALSAIPPERATQEPALRAALAYALATGNSPVADTIFSQLESQLPRNDSIKFAHQLLYLKHPKQEQRESAQRELEQLAQNSPALAVQIQREFISNALARADYAEAKKWLDRLVVSSEVTFSDRLQKANLDLLVDKKDFDPIYAELAPLAGSNATDAAEFLQWLLVQDRTPVAKRWTESLPQTLQAAAPVRSAYADVAAQSKDWDLLEQLVQSGAWGAVSKETVKLAMAAHTVDQPGRPSIRHETWDLALGSAGGSLASYRILQRFAALWRWDEETERTLWTIARTFPDQTWAHQSLFNIYRKKKNTAGMRDVIGALRDSEGTVLRYQHDWALLSLLTEPTNSWNPPKEMLRKAYLATPNDATLAAGYAFALAQSGKTAEALSVVEKMAAVDRDIPPRQPYIAFVYGCARKALELDRAIAIAQGADYLPEEAYLFTRARAELERKPEKTKAPASAPTADGPSASRL